jgi:hypothetical protein
MPYDWSLSFTIYSQGSRDVPYASRPALLWAHTVSMEVDLEPGQYVIQVHFDYAQNKPRNFSLDNLERWYEHKSALKWARIGMTALNLKGEY